MAAPLVDTVGSGSSDDQTTLTIALTVAANSNRALYCFVAVRNAGAGETPINTVNWNTSEAFTQLATVESASADQIYLFRLKNPTAGSFNVDITFDALAGTQRNVAGVYSLYNVDQTTSEGTPVTGTSTGTAITVAVTTTATQLAISSAAIRGGVGDTVTTAGDQTERWNFEGGGNYDMVGSDEAHSTGTANMAYTYSASREWTEIGVAVNVSAGGPTEISLAATVVAVPGLSRLLTLFRTLAATSAVTATITAIEAGITAIALAVTASAVATISLLKTLFVTLSATVAAVPGMSQLLTLFKTLASTAATIATINRQLFQTLTATVAATATISALRTITLQAVASITATIATVTTIATEVVRKVMGWGGLGYSNRTSWKRRTSTWRRR